jgi:hypothetical protein
MPFENQWAYSIIETPLILEGNYFINYEVHFDDNMRVGISPLEVLGKELNSNLTILLVAIGMILTLILIVLVLIVRHNHNGKDKMKDERLEKKKGKK